MKQKLILLSGLLMLILLSCKSDYGQIVEAKKQIMFAGVKNAPNHIRYTVKFDVNKPISLQEVYIKNNEKKIVLNHFAIKDLKSDHVFNGLNQIPPGKYLLTASVLASDENITAEDIISFMIKIPEKNKIYTLSAKVVQGKSIYMQ